MDKPMAIKDPDNVCFQCLKEFNINQLHKVKIPSLGYGGGFDNWSTEIHLCDKCINQTNLEWWKLEIEKFGNNNWCEKYKYEDEIFDYINTLPIEGQELFWNRYSDGMYSMNAQDWIDYKLNLLPHDKCKEYRLYSPEERRAYQERFPICKHVKLIKYKNGSKSCHCRFGAFGNEDGTAKGHQTQTRCYNCTNFEVREGEMMTVDMKEELDELTKRLKELKK